MRWEGRVLELGTRKGETWSWNPVLTAEWGGARANRESIGGLRGGRGSCAGFDGGAEGGEGDGEM